MFRTLKRTTWIFTIVAFSLSTTFSRVHAEGTVDSQIGQDTAVEAPAQPQANEDRSNKNGAAAAMAALGAAMAGVGCVMLMRQAMKEQDPAKRAQLMAMAMQQCAQATQSAASAAQNNEGKKTLSNVDPGAGPGLQMKPVEVPKDTADSKTGLPSVAANDTGGSDFPQDLSSGDTKTPSTGVGLPGTKGGDGTGDFDLNGFADSASNKLPDMAPKLKVDENATLNSTVNGAASLGAGSLSLGNARSETELKLEGSSSKGGSAFSGRPKGAGEEAGGDGSGGAGSGDDSKGGDSSLESMMASIFGTKDAEGGGGFGSAGDILALPPTKPGGKASNIFEYAAFRYRTAAYNEGRLQVRPTKREAIPSLRSLASVAP